MEIKRKNKCEKRLIKDLEINKAYLILCQDEEVILIRGLNNILQLMNHSNEKSLYIGGRSLEEEVQVIGKIYDFNISDIPFN